MKTGLLLLGTALLILAPAAWLVITAWSPVWPNLAASYITSAPLFVAHHVLTRRHADRRHAELLARLDQADAEQHP